MEDFSAGRTAPVSSMAMAMMFGTLTFATAALATRTWLTGDSRTVLVALHPKSQPLDVSSFTSIYSLLHHCSVFGLILFFAYICEYHPPFPHAEKTYDRDEFFFLIALLMVLSFYTVRKNDSATANANSNATPNMRMQQSNSSKHPNGSMSSCSVENNNVTGTCREEEVGDNSTITSFTTATTFKTKATFIHAAPTKACNDVLNRDQTEEWKGWMQFAFLFYHYYHAEEVYNSIRVMITCYVWMTGFGNFSFFYLKGDYSLVRVLQMLWRLNFLVFFLCLSQGTTYILYYICPLHTYFFLMVYLTMGCAKHLNYSKYGLRLKLGVLAFAIYALWDVDIGLFRLIHFPLGTQPQLGATNGALWEWYFRSSLDHWSTFLGMLFAANYPITSLFYRKLEALSPIKCWICKGVIASALIAITTVWVIGPFSQDKFEYNATNAYFGFIPLITYIFLRNLTPSLRGHSLHLLHEIGKTTLETYLMQHHIWLTSNAKSLLVLIPGWPKVNMLIVTIIYFCISRRLYKLTLYLRGMLLPNDKKKCISSMLWMAVIVTAFVLLAFFLDQFGLKSLTTIAIISIICGVLLYQTVINMTWDSHRQISRQSDDDSFSSGSFSKGQEIIDSSVTRFSPLVIGTMVIFIVGISWQGMAIAGAGKIKPLHSGCEAVVNRGHWVPVDGCNEFGVSNAYRSHGISSFATCHPASGAYIWGWETVPSSTQCRFIQRTEKQLIKSLNHQRIAFIGDSMTRNLYHAFCRLLGIQDAGQFDATGPKHQNIARTVKNTGIEFLWAPLASNQLKLVKDISEKIKQQVSAKYDLIVVGGGAWDRLHLYATDEDKQSLQETLAELKHEFIAIQQYDTPVVWVTPTTINTPALNTPEKQDHMTEKDMAEMRGIYEEAGILSASSFVLDGPAFSRERVQESYDGVHYPHYIYDAGAQIFANALDWLLEKKSDYEAFTAPEPGKMASPFLGLMMLCLSFIGLVFFDGFLGFSYLAGVFVKGVLPTDLYFEAFTILHEKMRLPRITVSSSDSIATIGNSTYLSYGSPLTKSQGVIISTVRRTPSGKDSVSNVDDEMAELLGTSKNNIDTL